MTERSTLKIELLPEQREQIRRAVAQEPPAMKLALEALEDRIAPMFMLRWSERC
jgi:hypothetical protein